MAAQQPPETPASPSDTSSDPPLGYTLSLGRNVSVSIEGDSLIVKDGNEQNRSRSRSRSRNRTCGGILQGSPQPSSSRSIPLYNVLWAELSNDHQTLTIDYAQETTRTTLQAAKLSFPASSKASYTDDEAHIPSAQTIIAWTRTLLDRAYGPAPRRKRAYVLVNPHAGPGGAAKKWNSEVKPLFEAARMPLTVHTTTYSGEAVDLAEKMNIDDFDIVVPCSGDGLPHEVFNGLARRPDARRALQSVSVAHVPCGSGNALACNVFGTHRVGLAALAIVKGVPTPMDLISITQGDRRTMSFLSQALGIIAEADLATEHLRWMGEHRFTYGVAKRILKKKTYPCDLWVKVEIGHKEGVKEHYKRERENGAIGGGEQTGKSTTDGNSSPLGREASSVESEAEASEALPRLKYGTVNDKLPEGWEKIPADKIGNFYCGNVAYMAPDVIFFNAAWISDGYMDLITVDGDVPTSKAPGLMLSVSNNSFFDNPLVTYRKVSAFRIVPKYAEPAYISIDGERVPFEPFQAEVHRGLGMVITKRGVLEAPGPTGWEKVSVGQRSVA